jgi:hypothetical protein
VPKFLCLQRSLPGEASGKASPAEMQAMYAKFNAWREKFQTSLVDMGGRLGKGRLVASQPPSDGPFVDLRRTAPSWRSRSSSAAT